MGEIGVWKSLPKIRAKPCKNSVALTGQRKEGKGLGGSPPSEGRRKRGTEKKKTFDLNKLTIPKKGEYAE